MPESELELFITSLNVTYLWKKVFWGIFWFLLGWRFLFSLREVMKELVFDQAVGKMMEKSSIASSAALQLWMQL